MKWPFTELFAPPTLSRESEFPAQPCFRIRLQHNTPNFAVNSLLITNARIIDPASGTDANGDLLIIDGKISALGKNAGAKARKELEALDAKGAVVCPGLI